MKAAAWILAIILGVVGGIAATRPALLAYYDHGMIANGPWRTHPDIGSADANPWIRALVTAGGLFALNRSEAIYFSANTLHDEALSNRCHYVIEGNEFDARWWSLTVYDQSSYLIPNEAGRHSYNNSNVARAANGRWSIHVAPSMQEVNWLPSRKPEHMPEPKIPKPLGAALPGNPDQIRLIFRLYHPADSYRDSPATATLPTIRREGCA